MYKGLRLWSFCVLDSRREQKYSGHIEAHHDGEVYNEVKKVVGDPEIPYEACHLEEMGPVTYWALNPDRDSFVSVNPEELDKKRSPAVVRKYPSKTGFKWEIKVLDLSVETMKLIGDLIDRESPTGLSLFDSFTRNKVSSETNSVCDGSFLPDNPLPGYIPSPLESLNQYYSQRESLIEKLTKKLTKKDLDPEYKALLMENLKDLLREQGNALKKAEAFSLSELRISLRERLIDLRDHDEDDEDEDDLT